jgi:hypothetical protein
MTYILTALWLVLSLKTRSGYIVRWHTFSRVRWGGAPYLSIREFNTLWPAVKWCVHCGYHFTELDSLVVAPGGTDMGAPVPREGTLAIQDSGGLTIQDDSGGLSL